MTGPLQGVRIVLTGDLGPGPFCGMLLAVGPGAGVVGHSSARGSATG